MTADIVGAGTAGEADEGRTETCARVAVVEAPTERRVIPSPFDERVAAVVLRAVVDSAVADGVARTKR